VTRTYAITDDCGNVVNCTQIITVNDTIDPTCSVTAANTGPPCGEVTITITKGDNCDPDPAVIDVDWGDGTHDTNTVHQYLSTGTFTITVTVEDECNNTGTCSDTVTVPGTMVTLNFVAGWNMISIPCEPWTDDFALLFGDPTLVNGLLYRYNHTAGSYDGAYDDLINAFPTERGRGYWLWAWSDYSISFLACCSTPFDIDCPTSGWYMIGYPHATAATAMSSLQVDAGGGWRTFTDAVTNPPILCQDPLFWYNPSKMGYDNVGIRPWDNLFSMELGKGYWFLTFVDNVTLRVP
jgi:PKD repeat protein